MADEDQAHAPLGHQPVQHAQHLQLHGDVERRGGFVGDQQLRAGDQHHRDHGALAHAAGDLVRVELHHPRRVLDAHGGQRFGHLLPGLRAAAGAVRLQRLGDLRADAHDRVERVLRVLQHHRDAAAAQRAALVRRAGQQVDAVEAQRLRADAAPGRRQAQDGAAGLTLAAARFTHDAQPLAAEREADAAHHLRQATLAVGVGHAQVVDGEQRRPHAEPFGSSASRSPSPSRLKPRLTTKIAAPGAAATHHWSST